VLPLYPDYIVDDINNMRQIQTTLFHCLRSFISS